MSKHPLTIALLCVSAAGCGGSHDAGPPTAQTATSSTSTSTPATTVVPSPISVTVFRTRNGKLVAHAERVPGTRAVAAASLTALGLAAPTTVAGGTATVDREDATPADVAEIVYTLTQYPSIQRVDVAGRTGVTRADIAEFVPPILVERPAAGATTGTTIQVAGSASVYEATVVLELRQGGRVVQ